MKNSFLKFAVCGLLAVAVVGAPLTGFAQEDKKEKAEKKEGGEKKKGNPPINGKVAAVDKTAKTVTIGQTVIHITSETRIQKAGQPATIDDITVGEQGMAVIRKTDDGKVEAMRFRIGPRPEGEAKKGEGEGKKKKE